MSRPLLVSSRTMSARDWGVSRGRFDALGVGGSFDRLRMSGLQVGCEHLFYFRGWEWGVSRGSPGQSRFN